MKKIINYLLPVKLHLHMLQLEEYKPGRYLRWISKHFFTREVSSKKKLIYTRKVKNILLIYMLLCVLGFILNFWIFLILLVQPYIGLTIAVFILKPYEFYIRQKTINDTRDKVLSFKNMKVIGITGSFGKSSTKEILYQLIKGKYRTLRTPESYNTVFGVAKVVDLELDSSYEYFICEMAAYKIGEIKTLCFMVPPTYGILTGITTQHFDRFGSLANTVKAKFELVDAVSDKSKMVFNLGDENISQELTKRGIKDPEGFLEAKDITFTKDGSKFELVFQNKSYQVKTPLFGLANIKNILAAASMALKLGLTREELVEGINKLSVFDNRLVLIKDKGAVVVNNTYSSNPQGFKETIETAKKIKGKKVLVTPGLVELGQLEESVHLELGRLSFGVFDEVVLVGENNRTKNFASGFRGKISYIPDRRDAYFKTIEELKNKYEWIFLENDVTENY